MLHSDKFTLSVVDLSQIALATEGDKTNGIDAPAALFKATEWEEIKMLARRNPWNHTFPQPKQNNKHKPVKQI